MKFRIQLLALILGFGLAVPAIAQEEQAKPEPVKEEPAKAEPAKEAPPAEEAPAKEEPAKEEPAKEEAAKAAEAAAPAAAAAAAPAAAAAAAPAAAAAAAPAAAAAAAPAAAAAAAAAPPAKKELSSCAKSFSPLADSYKAAYDGMQKWIGQIDTETSAASDKVAKLQKQISDNEAEITKAKLAGDSSKAKSIDKTNKQLWTDLNASKKSLSTMCSGYGKQAAERVKQYEAASDKALADLKAQSK